MPTVFLSHSSKDRFFAELLELKLNEAGITSWRDQSELRAGNDWRQGIEQGIAASRAVIVVLSENSAESPYVTFEWAYALGNSKAVIPIKLNDCKIHPRLDAMQHLDFSSPSASDWKSLIDQIQRIETETPDEPAVVASASKQDDTYAQAILTYLNQRGYQMASFERLSRVLGKDLSNKEFNEIIVNNPTVFRHAMLAGGKPGIAKLNP